MTALVVTPGASGARGLQVRNERRQTGGSSEQLFHRAKHSRVFGDEQQVGVVLVLTLDGVHRCRRRVRLVAVEAVSALYRSQDAPCHTIELRLGEGVAYDQISVIRPCLLLFIRQ